MQNISTLMRDLVEDDVSGIARHQDVIKTCAFLRKEAIIHFTNYAVTGDTNN